MHIFLIILPGLHVLLTFTHRISIAHYFLAFILVVSSAHLKTAGLDTAVVVKNYLYSYNPQTFDNSTIEDQAANQRRKAFNAAFNNPAQQPLMIQGVTDLYMEQKDLKALHDTIHTYETAALVQRNDTSSFPTGDLVSEEALELYVNAERILAYSADPLASVHKFIRTKQEQGQTIAQTHLHLMFAVNHIIERKLYKHLHEGKPQYSLAVIDRLTRTYVPDTTQNITSGFFDRIKTILSKKHYKITELQNKNF